jgi:hypothetical protein
MTTSTDYRTDFFIRAAAALAILGPILLVIIAGTLPDDSARGQLIVAGHCEIVVALAAILLVRAVYYLGFSTALKRLAETKPNQSVTA